MPYTPAVGDRITVRRTPGKHSPTGAVTGLVLDIVTIGGVDGILDFRDDLGPRVYLATNKQLAADGVVQTIERARD